MVKLKFNLYLILFIGLALAVPINMAFANVPSLKELSIRALRTTILKESIEAVAKKKIKSST